MLLAAIDIGTNAVRLFFSNVFSQSGRVVVEKASLVRIPLRLGEDVFTLRKISEEKILRLSKTMQAFNLLIDVNQPVAWKACATSAMREAKNGREVIDRIYKETGIAIEIIDGLKEASLVSAFSDFRKSQSAKYHMFIDVGGGSTEISVLKGSSIVASNSFKIGTVRLLNGKVREKEWESLKKWLKTLRDKWKDTGLVGSGGNINKITKLYGKIPENTLSVEQLEQAMAHLESFTVEERILQLGLRPDRADVITHAGRIFRFIMRHVKAREIYVPKIGLSDGIVHSLYLDRMKE
jgi:exopolyphosphatase / guanosine-5'-triphosphate,3'-diphosphate pyrophosphatase